MDNAGEALVTSKQAMEVAQQARTSVETVTAFTKSVSDQVGNILADIRAMRQENSQQHSEGRAFNQNNFDTINTRISTVVRNQDEIKSDLMSKIDEVKKESSDGDQRIIDANAKRREKFLRGVIYLLAALLLGFIGKETGIQINWPF